MRGTVEPTVDEHGDETHPAWGMIGAYRTSGGAVLFDSEIKHQHYVVVKLQRATRRRQLNRDYIHGRGQVVEIAMSEAQWASFVSSMNTSGVPCTIKFDATGWLPEMPYAPRLAESIDEVRTAAEEAMQKIRDAFEVVKEKPNKGNLRHLEAMIDNAPSNMVFAADSLTEHAENVVQKAKADIEAFVVDKAAQIGLEPGEVMGELPVLESGE